MSDNFKAGDFWEEASSTDLYLPGRYGSDKEQIQNVTDFLRENYESSIEVEVNRDHGSADILREMETPSGLEREMLVYSDWDDTRKAKDVEEKPFTEISLTGEDGEEVSLEYEFLIQHGDGPEGYRELFTETGTPRNFLDALEDYGFNLDYGNRGDEI